MTLHVPFRTACSCLLSLTLVGCAAGGIAGTDDTGGCEASRPATMTVTGLPVAVLYACGLVQNNAGSSFMNATFKSQESNHEYTYLVVQAGAAPGSYPVSAANYGKISINYGTTDQTGFCDTPSGTIVVTSYTNPAPNGDQSHIGRIRGSFTNVTLCGQYSSRKVPSLTISGVFEIR